MRGRSIAMMTGVAGIVLAVAGPAVVHAQTVQSLQTAPQRPQAVPPQGQAPLAPPSAPGSETRTWSGEHRPRPWGPPYWGPPGPGWYDPSYTYYPSYPYDPYYPSPPRVYVPGQWVWTGYSWAWVPAHWEYQLSRPW